MWEEERRDKSLDESHSVSYAVLGAICEEKRGHICARGVVCSRGIELEKVKYRQRCKEKTRAPELAAMVCEHGCHGKTKHGCAAKEEGTHCDSHERALPPREKLWGHGIGTLGLHIGRLLCPQTRVELRGPFTRLCGSVDGERDVDVRSHHVERPSVARKGRTLRLGGEGGIKP